MSSTVDVVPEPAPPGPDTNPGYGEKDVAIRMVGMESHAVYPAITARAVRKIDWFLIPAMTVGCMLQSFDTTHHVLAHLLWRGADLD